MYFGWDFLPGELIKIGQEKNVSLIDQCNGEIIHSAISPLLLIGLGSHQKKKLLEPRYSEYHNQIYPC